MLNSPQDAINQCPCERRPDVGTLLLSLGKPPCDGMDTDAPTAPDATNTTLDAVILERHLGDLLADREIVDVTTSTNADLLARARQRAPLRPVLRVAQRQTQGRGRRGRSWHGNDAGSLLFSLALPWARDPAASAAVTLACGIAAAAAIQQWIPANGARVLVKWPNDLLLHGGKLAGILVELADDAHGARTLVIGMGINLCSDLALRDRIASDRAKSEASPAAVGVADLASVLGSAAVLSQREIWLARLARALLTAAQGYQRNGFAGGPAAFAACCAYRDAVVEAHNAGGPVITGILRGVDSAGRLLLDSGGALQPLNSGEISLRSRDAGGAP